MKTILLKSTTLRSGKPIITCENALRLAETFDVSPKRIGKLCNDNAIKIRKCKLGCFA
jgi:plasmid maintenance system antidote protein VapI